MALTFTITEADRTLTFTVREGVGPAGPNQVNTTTATNITGLLKGDGSTVSAAVADTDYQSVPAEGAFADGDKTKLDGLGTMSTQNANSVSITGGSVTGLSSLQGSSITLGDDSNAGFATFHDGSGSTAILGAPNTISAGTQWNLPNPNASVTFAGVQQSDGSIRATDLDFAGSTDIGAALADADEIIISDGGGNTTRRKSALSRVWTYIKAKIESVALSALEITGDLTVDTDTLKVIAASNRVDMLRNGEVLRLGEGNLTGDVYSSFNLRGFVGYQGSSGGPTILQAGSGKELWLTSNSSTFGSTPDVIIDTSGNFKIGASASIQFTSNSGTWDGATIAGDQDFTGQVKLTGQAASSDDAAMTRSLVDRRHPSTAVLDSDLVITSETTFQSIPMTASKNPDGVAFLGFNVEANSQYTLEAFIQANDASNPRNQKYNLSAPSGTTGFISLFATANSGSPANYSNGSSSLACSNSLSSGTSGGVVRIVWIIQTSTTSGTVYAQVAQQASSATSITIKKGSSLTIHRN